MNSGMGFVYEHCRAKEFRENPPIDSHILFKGLNELTSISVSWPSWVKLDMLVEDLHVRPLRNCLTKFGAAKGTLY
jgi:hypothetical protein